jgi:hypothetical protein
MHHKIILGNFNLSDRNFGSAAVVAGCCAPKQVKGVCVSLDGPQEDSRASAQQN